MPLPPEQTNISYQAGGTGRPVGGPGRPRPGRRASSQVVCAGSRRGRGCRVDRRERGKVEHAAQRGGRAVVAAQVPRDGAVAVPGGGRGARRTRSGRPGGEGSAHTAGAGRIVRSRHHTALSMTDRDGRDVAFELKLATVSCIESEAGTGAGPRRWVGDRWGRRTDRGSGPQPRVSGGQRWREVSRDRPPRRAGAGSVPVLRAWPAPTQTDPTGSIVVHRRDPPPSPIIRPRKVRPCHCCSSTSSKADTLVRSKRCSTAHAAMVEAFEVPEHPRGQPQAHPRAEGETLRAAGRAAATRLRSRPG
ncbi:MAG: hypothetical protein QOI36_6138 [Pseudonocardiales bacterium]|nr:hypothetical protein [Pseudonocardiales bacterium]